MTTPNELRLEREKNNTKTVLFLVVMWIGVAMAIFFPGTWYGPLVLNIGATILAMAMVFLASEYGVIQRFSAEGKHLEEISARLAGSKTLKRDKWAYGLLSLSTPAAFVVMYFATDYTFSTTILGMVSAAPLCTAIAKHAIINKQETI